MLRITKVVLLVRMANRFILFLAFLLGGILPLLAQARQDTQSSGSAESRIAMLATDSKSLNSEEYATAQSSATLPTGQILTNSFALHRQKNSLLLHLKDDHNQVSLQVTNAVGSIVQTSAKNFTSGFYELPILNDRVAPGIYVIKLVINEQTITLRSVK